MGASRNYGEKEEIRRKVIYGTFSFGEIFT